MEDVHRAGGIMAILGELDRAGLLDARCRPCTAATLADALDAGTSAHQRARRSAILLSRGARRRADAGRLQPGAALRLARSRPQAGVIRSAEHAFSQDGGLAVLYGNLALDGCIVKTAGVDESILKFSGPAKVL
jgi:dihydroxy-acid dehydratase